jgi:ribosomal protein L37AE/L43A
MTDQELKQKILTYMQENNLDVLPDLEIISKMGISKGTLYKRYGSLKDLAGKMGIPYERDIQCPVCGKTFQSRYRYSLYCSKKCQHDAIERPKAGKFEKNLFRPFTKETPGIVAGDFMRGYSIEEAAESSGFDLDYFKKQVNEHREDIVREMFFIDYQWRHPEIPTEGRMTHIFQRPYETKVKRNIYGAMG